MGEIPHVLPSPNPFDQAEVSSHNWGQIPPALPFPNPFGQAEVSSTHGGQIPPALLFPNPFEQARAPFTDLGEILHDLPFPDPFNQTEAASSTGLLSVKSWEIALDGLEESCPCIPLRKILLATNDFDNALVIGTGGFGKVYKAIIDKGATVVAVKRLDVKSKQGAEEFWTEVELLSKFHHTNLVSLIGYCNESQEMILVYEYIACGTLANRLYKTSREESDESKSHLTWMQRLKICLHAARGLNYLHNGTGQDIIHRDVKSTNILLDEHLVAKVSDFGLSKTIIATHVSTNVKGTIGYLDPDYFFTNRLTKKSDVYAFGVVLLEVLCGRPPVDTRLEEEQISLILWAKMYIKKGKLDRIIDQSLSGEITPQSLKYFAKLANNCLHTQPKERPTMSEVVGILEIALASHERKPRSQRTIAKAFQRIKFVPKGMNHRWGEGKGNHSNNVGGPSKHPFSENDGGGPSKHPFLENDSRGLSENDGGGSSKHLFSENDGGRPPNHPFSENDGGGSSKHPFSENDGEGPSKHQFSENFKSVHRHFSLAEIRAATESFSKNLLISQDGCSKLYKGSMANGTLVVAIKRFELISGKKGAEIELKCLARHPNIMSLIGFCDEENELILVHDYMVNGILKSHIDETNKDPLPWKKRLEICIDVARGLEYLHTNVEQQLAHWYVKPSSVFLDDKWVAKLTNYELSGLLAGEGEGQEYAMSGTLGYLDPEHQQTSIVTKKSEVYAFGVMLLEVLCAKTPYSLMRNIHKVCLLDWFRACILTIDEVIDPYLLGQIAPECFRNYVILALRCVVDEGIRRPSMDNVLCGLQSSLQMQEAWENSVKMGAELHMADVPQSYNDVFRVEREFTIGGQRFDIFRLTRG